MLNFNRRDGAPADPKDAGKFALKPALYEPPSTATASAAARNPQAAPPPRPELTPPTPAAVAPTPAPTPAQPAPAESAALPGSKLHVGVNIKLKGVEISDCDNVVIEGQVEATVHSKVMEIQKPGTLKGTALIDIAEVHGDFTGEITARTRLVIHGTGRVSGTIRYGSLVVEDGGELSGDVKQLERPAGAAARPGAAPAQHGEALARRA